MQKKIEFYRHNLSIQDKQSLLEVLDSLFLTTGKVVEEFENKFARYMGSSYAVGVTSCTQALELALRYYGIGPGDEVITTPLSFIATANVIEYVGARPVFVDVEKTTGNIDASLIEKAITSRTKAIIAVHLYGQMCDMKAIRKIANLHNLKVIEDAAHCVEGTRDGIRPGQLGDVACYSFYATKNLACGEGGALSCNDAALYEWLLKARQHGMSRNAADRYHKKYEHYDMEFLGLKCNMSNMQAALLVNQLDRLQEFLEIKKFIVNRYNEAFKNNRGITLLEVAKGVEHAYHLYTIVVNAPKRDVYLHALQEQGIGVAVNFRPIHRMSYYKNKYDYQEGSFQNAEYIGARTITLPLYPKLSLAEVDYIIESVNRIVDMS